MSGSSTSYKTKSERDRDRDIDREREREREKVDAKQNDGLISKSVKKPSNENFELDYAANLRLINDKFTKLAGDKRNLEQYINDFNYYFGQLLELKEVHKKAYPLSTIGLIKNDISGGPGGAPGAPGAPTSNIHPLKHEKLPQYFSCLKCCSNECKGGKRMMAVFQFDDKNKLVDTKLLKYKTENQDDFEVLGNPKIERIDENHFLQISKAFNLRESFYDKDDKLINDKNDYDKDLDRTRYGSTGENLAMNKKTKNTSLIDDKLYNKDGQYDIIISNKGKSFRCGCHFDKFTTCGNRDLIKKIDTCTYEFNPIKKDENKTIFFCYSCKQFFRYDCLRSKNEDNDITNVDHCLVGVNEDIKNTLVSINSNMLFRKPMFDKEFSDHLETVAGTIHKGLSKSGLHVGLGEMEANISKLALLGMAVGVGAAIVAAAAGSVPAGITGAVAAGVPVLRGVGKGIVRGVRQPARGKKIRGTGIKIAKDFLMHGGGGQDYCEQLQGEINEINEINDTMVLTGNISIDGPNDCGRHHRDISRIKNSKPGPASTAVPSPPPQPGPASVAAPKLGFLQPKIYNNDTDTRKDFTKKYGRLVLRDTFEDFMAELNKWRVSPKEEGFINRLDVGYTNNKLNEKDKSKFRPEFIRLQNEYIREFMTRVSEYKGYYPFRSSDFEFLRGLRISGDDSGDAYSSETLKLLGINYRLNSDTDNIDSINQNTENKEIQGYLKLNDREKISQLLNSSNISKKEKINIACDKSFDFNEIEFTGKYAFILKHNPNLRTYLGKLGKLESKGPKQAFRSINIDNTSQTDEIRTAKQQWEIGNDHNNQLFEMYKGYLDYYKFKLDESKLESIILGDNIVDEYGAATEDDSGGVFLEGANNIFRDLLVGLKPNDPPDNRTELKLKYETIGKIISNKETYKNMLSSLKSDFEKKKNKLNENMENQRNNKKTPHDYEEYRGLIRDMCGSKASTFWFGLPDNDNLNEEDYRKIRSLFSSLRILYLPWYDKTLLKSLDNPDDRITILTEDNIKGKLTRFTNGSVPPVGIGDTTVDLVKIRDIIPLLDKSPLYEEYRTEVLPLFPLLEYSNSNHQLLKDQTQGGHHSNDYYTVTQLNKTKNILSGSQCLDIKDNKHIWNEPRDTKGVTIVTPIKLLQLKKDILEVAKKFYNMENSLNNDIKLQEEWKKEYKKWEKQKNKGDGNGDGNGDGGTSTVSGVGTSDGMIDTGGDDFETSEDKTSEDKSPQVDLEKEKHSSLELSQDKLYTKDDVSNENDELEKLKRELERKELVLKNIASNIKLLKSQRHGEDSEQRQLQQQEYEQKERELILFQKLVEQREEKLKVLKILTDKLSEKDEKESSEKLRNGEIEEQQNLLNLHSQIGGIVNQNFKVNSFYQSSVQNDEISSLKNKLNSLEGYEIDTRQGLVQNGGGWDRRDEHQLNRLLYKTESRRNRTKNKRRNNDRKKDRSLRKRF